MKKELLKDKVFRHIDEVIAAVSVAVNFNNNEKPRMSIGMLIQVKAANLSGTSFRAKPSSQPLTGITTLGQQLSAQEFSTKIYFKDKIGHKDSITVSIRQTPT